MTTRIKICCVSSLAEAALAVKSGASAIGLVSEMPSGPGVISEPQIAEIAQVIPPAVSTVLLTSKRDTASIIQQQKRCGTNTLQLCDRVDESVHIDLRRELPGIKVLQVIHVTGTESLQEASRIADRVDGILLDSGNRSGPVKELGGTGRTHNWEISRQIVKTVKLPVFLAGGLNPGNIHEAVQKVKPFGVDVCSGIRSNDQLDEIKLKQFCAEVRAADFKD